MATYIINWLPSQVLEWKTSYEKIHNTKSDYSRLRVFGCPVYCTVTKPHISKFDPRAVKAVFLGYVLGEKSYKLYDLESYMIYSSQDVWFYKDISLFKSSLSLNDVGPLPVLVIELEEANDEYNTPDAIEGSSTPAPSLNNNILPN